MTIARIVTAIVFYLLISYGVMKANAALIEPLSDMKNREKLTLFLLWPLIDLAIGIGIMASDLFDWWNE